MVNFEYFTPTKVVFGKNAEEKTGELIKAQGCKKVLVHYGGNSAKKSGLLDRICVSLEKKGISYVTLGGVVPNPHLSKVHEGIELCKKEGVDFILAVGGGSVIDSGKAIGYGVANEGEVWDFYAKKRIPEACLPVGAVLTIAAAGSEMSDSAVLTNEETGKKAGAHSDLVRPKFAMMNPELMYTLPKYQLTCGIVDIMMHTMERYFTPVDGNELTDEIAEGVLRIVIRNGLKAYEDQQNYDALSEIMWCGSISHNNMTGLGRPKDFACHKLGHEIGGMFDEAHGATLSAVWGSWARYVYQIDIPRFAHFGRKVWGIEEVDDIKAALAAIEETEKFFERIEMPVCIGQMKTGVLEDDVLMQMADSATKGDTVELGSFKKLKKQDMYEIYKAANHE